MSAAGVSVLDPGRRPVRVNLAEHVRVSAGVMSAAVAEWCQASPRARRARVAEIAAGHVAERPRFGLAAGPTALTVVQTPDGRVHQTKLAKNDAATVGLTIQSAGGCRVVLDDGRVMILHTCPDAGACAGVCVLQHGRGEWARVRAARDWRTFVLWADPAGFAVRVRAELGAAAARHGRILARLNVASDIPWHLVPEVLDVPGVAAYDYTKAPDVLNGNGWAAGNYRRVYSWSEKSDPCRVAAFLAAGGTVAMVTDRGKGDPVVPWVALDGRAFPVVDGDASDDRVSDPAGCIVDLYAKGRARERSHRSRLVVPIYSVSSVVETATAGRRRVAS